MSYIPPPFSASVWREIQQMVPEWSACDRRVHYEVVAASDYDRLANGDEVPSRVTERWTVTFCGKPHVFRVEAVINRSSGMAVADVVVRRWPSGAPFRPSGPAP